MSNAKPRSLISPKIYDRDTAKRYKSAKLEAENRLGYDMTHTQFLALLVEVYEYHLEDRKA